MDKLTAVQSKAKKLVRARIYRLAEKLNSTSGGKIQADDVTVAALAAHFPIAFLIAQDQLFISGVLLIIFGLFDLLDGALARVQGSSSPRGMFMDASTDRFKETLVFAGFAVLFASEGSVFAVLLTALALGLSISVSYVKAKGEAALAIAKPGMEHAELNRIFDDGLGSLEVRSGLLIIGSLLRIPEIVISVIVILTVHTIFVRTIKILKALS